MLSVMMPSQFDVPTSVDDLDSALARPLARAGVLQLDLVRVPLADIVGRRGVEHGVVSRLAVAAGRARDDVGRLLRGLTLEVRRAEEQRHRAVARHVQ